LETFVPYFTEAHNVSVAVWLLTSEPPHPRCGSQGSSRNREIGSAMDVEALVKEIASRLLESIQAGVRVRLV
jgi:hypothetical protein